LPLDGVVAKLLSIEPGDHRPFVIAVDGRGASGKSTLAERIHRAVPKSGVVHTDDIAWHHSFFDWGDLLVDNVLRPVWNGESVDYRPPGWVSKGRSGSVKVDAGLDLVIIEGVGASRAPLAPWLDCSVWIQSDFAEAERRGLIRDGGTDAVLAFWNEWMSHEVPFLQRDRPWERATLIVSGTPTLPHDPDDELVVADGPLF
jgi:hypothetical protein